MQTSASPWGTVKGWVSNPEMIKGGGDITPQGNRIFPGSREVKTGREAVEKPPKALRNEGFLGKRGAPATTKWPRNPAMDRGKRRVVRETGRANTSGPT